VRHVALLRGISPLDVKMPALARCFEQLGFTDVRTVLASGNVVFSSRKRSTKALETTIARGMQTHLGKTFGTFVRSVAELRAILASDPYGRLPAKAKRVVTFLRAAPRALKLPIELDGARIVALHGREAFSAYVVKPGDPVFMRLIEKTFGKDVTTRTWDTVTKLAR
jgi:uncharacterized protein (DUF1697 family)